MSSTLYGRTTVVSVVSWFKSSKLGQYKVSKNIIYIIFIVVSFLNQFRLNFIQYSIAHFGTETGMYPVSFSTE